MRRRYAVAAVAGAVAVLGTFAVVVLKNGGDGVMPGARTTRHADVRLAGGSFTIGGDAVGPLSPGRSAAIDVELSISSDGPLLVTRLHVRVRAVSAPNADQRHPCSRLDFAVRQVRPAFSVTVPAHATGSLSRLGVDRRAWPLVRMVDRPVNQDGCKGASITLAYVGSGRLGR